MLEVTYKLKCDMCGDVLEVRKSEDKYLWQHQLPVRGATEVVYMMLDLCPHCYESVALRPVEVGGETRYVRKEDEC